MGGLERDSSPLHSQVYTLQEPWCVLQPGALQLGTGEPEALPRPQGQLTPVPG